MLKAHKNDWFEMVRDWCDESNFDMSIFEFQEQENRVFSITLKNSPLLFLIKQIPDNFDVFSTTGTEFRPGYPLRVEMEQFEAQTSRYKASSVNDQLYEWLYGVVGRYIDEIEMPDLWKLLQNFSFFSSSSTIPQNDLLPFNEDEKTQVKESLKQLEKHLEEKYDLLDEQLRFTNERLEYLTKAVDRLNRFDWKAQAASILTSIAINLGVDTTTGNALLIFVQQQLGYLANNLLSK